MQHAVRNIQSFRHRLETVHVCFGIRPVRFPDLCVFRTCAFSGIRLFFWNQTVRVPTSETSSERALSSEHGPRCSSRLIAN